jgi:glycosyltransferase involved in cell wall biosynthesis
MRIAFVNSIRSYGGGEARVLRSAAEFHKRGHAVSVLGRPDGALAVRCPQSGIPFRGVRFGHYAAPATLDSIARALREAQADVAVTYDLLALRATAVAARLAGGTAPRVVHYYGLEGAFKDRTYNRLFVLPRVARFVPNADALRRELVTFRGIDPSRVQVIYDGVDPEPILSADPAGVREALEAGPDDVVALVVARLAANKGHRFLLDALAGLAPKHPRLQVWVAGDGPERGAVEARIRELDLEKSVRLLGFRSDVPRLLRAADLLCHSSRREGVPNSAREAMVAGLPVVALAVSGVPELVLDGVTGLLSAEGDLEMLQANLERLVGDAALRQRMGEAGRQRALAEYSEDRCAELWLDLLEGCLTETREKRASSAAYPAGIGK